MKTYGKYTIHNKKGMNGFHTFFTSPRFFNFSFHHFMNFLFNLLISKVLDLDLYDRPYSLHLNFTAFKNPELHEALMNIGY